MPSFHRSAPASLLLLTLLAAGCTDDNDAATTPIPPDAVTFTRSNLYPEGVQYDGKNARFLVSSQTAGQVGQVKDDGTYAPLADDSTLVSTIGLYLDEDRGRLLVAVSDPGYNLQRTRTKTKGKLARLAFFNRDNGQFTAIANLSALRPGDAHFANDIAVDKDGNAYVTDSFSPIIYKVTPQGVASIFLENEQLRAPAGKFGLNGIVYHPDGYLLVAKSDVGTLFKVPLAAPGTFTKVVTSQDLAAVDGLRLQDNNTLYAACNAQARVYRLSSADNWGNAAASGAFVTPPQYPTTLARRSDQATYVLYSNLNALQANQNPPVADFTVAKLKF